MHDEREGRWLHTYKHGGSAQTIDGVLIWDGRRRHGRQRWRRRHTAITQKQQGFDRLHFYSLQGVEEGGCGRGRGVVLFTSRAGREGRGVVRAARGRGDR